MNIPQDQDEESKGNKASTTRTINSTVLRPTLHTQESGEVMSRTDREFEDSLDENLTRAIKNSAKLSVCAPVGTEVWVLNSDRSKIVPLKSVWEVDKNNCNEHLLRLTDESREDFIANIPVVPGVGLAGNLLVEATQGNVAWRDLEALSEDPLVAAPINPRNSNESRMFVLPQAGLGMGAGACFNINGHEGIVIYMYGKERDLDLLLSKRNQLSLLVATELIGTVFAANQSFQKCMKRKVMNIYAANFNIDESQDNDGNWFTKSFRESQLVRSFRNSYFVTSFRKKKAAKKASPKPPQVLSNDPSSAYHIFKRKIKTYAKKGLGAGALPPPPLPLNQAVWTFVGCFVSFAVLGNMSQLLHNKTNGEHLIMLAPLGPLVTMAFAMPSSPPAQPSITLLGQALACTISKAIGQVNGLPMWLSQAAALSITCTLNAVLGLSHPPAGASAAIFANSLLSGWMDIPLVLLGNVVIIVLAVIINNLSDKRQYPSFWRLARLRSRN